MVSIICCTMRQHCMDNVFQNYENQIVKEKELIIILNHDDMDINSWKERARQSQNVTVFHLPEKVTLGECLNYGIGKTKYSVIAKFDDDDYYAPSYLEQSLNVLNRANVHIVGKKSVFMYFIDEKILAIHRRRYENMFVKGGIKGATLVFKKYITEKVKFPNMNNGEDTFFLKECIDHNYRIFSTDKYNYACLRASNSGQHTWNPNKNILSRDLSLPYKTDDFKPFIVNPKHND
ncbi:glycosyltransferase family 2 protein [Bacillus sp. FJAT-49705]|uniref:Glycosyltransferase family 2 protein n=1 Tax=Cytobacillus citreus TaxID=2833586 RepID=A0ABS5NYL6_9BACI|nr:glycosyltransferase family A protein [Cytobacillus citreus]MBS4192696.1 glycosyltransferase family 2 protein [Cytobacillus citreus]